MPALAEATPTLELQKRVMAGPDPATQGPRVEILRSGVLVAAAERVRVDDIDDDILRPGEHQDCVPDAQIGKAGTVR